MKVKLLKKIRKRFSIEYYPNRKDDYKYLLIDNDESSVGKFENQKTKVWHNG